MADITVTHGAAGWVFKLKTPSAVYWYQWERGEHNVVPTAFRLVAHHIVKATIKTLLISGFTVEVDGKEIYLGEWNEHCE